MRRRFGRRRGGEGEDAIDAGAALERLRSGGFVEVASLEPIEVMGVPASLAALGAGEGTDGKPLLVAFSPRGGDALLGALAGAGARSAEGAFEGGTALAVAPVWTPAARRRLGLAAPRFRFAAREAAALADGVAAPESEAAAAPTLVTPAQVAARIADPAQAELFARATAGLAGLAAKHGGSLRGVTDSVELVLQARRVASVQAGDGIALETWLPRRASDRLDAAGLADALDRLEGQLRKRLNDRHVREGEEGLRARLVGDLASSAGLRSVARWPLPGSDPESLDFVALDAEGRPVAGAIRRSLDLAGLGPILDAVLAVPAALPVALAGAAPPVRIEMPRLLVASDGFSDAVMHVLSEITLEVSRVSLADASLTPQTVNEGRGSAPAARREGGRGRSRRRGGRRRDGEKPAPDVSAEEPQERQASEPAPPRFAELSAFDLDGDDDEERPRRSRRRGGRRRREGGRGGGGGSAAKDEGDDAEAEPERPRARGRRAEGRRAEARPEPEPAAAEADAVSEPDVDDAELDGDLVPLAEDVPEPEVVQAEPAYDDEEEVAAEVSEEEKRRQARESRRRTAQAEPEAPPAPPERPRRAVIVAHADRGSVAAAILLARETRQLEGLWIYEQADLMTFFRSVATDLRDDVPIFLVGFTAWPAVDTLQAASLYRGRIRWFDHHAWPPEDLEAMARTIGEDALEVVPHLDSPLPLVLGACTRRSRFSDKLVDLATARFTEHDFTRWGRLWWSRIGELLTSEGDRRSLIEPLLAGRPSDLAKAASRAAAPDPPPELAWATERDFPLAHFGGYTLVLVGVDPEIDPYLAARIVRERYGAQLSLAWRGDDEVVVLAGEDARSKRDLDLQAMAEHLANKHDWIDPLPGADHVARFRVRERATIADHTDAVVAEIAMGRSILEG